MFNLKKSTMLEYCKTILCKVSFNSVLFEKEFIKALKILNEEDKEAFLSWSLTKFKSTHYSFIQQYARGNSLRIPFAPSHQKQG